MGRGAAILGVALAAVVAAACTSGSSERGDPRAEVPPQTTVAPGVGGFTIAAAQLEAPEPALTTIPDDVVGGVVAALDRYLAAAVIAPLESGQPAGDLAPLFTPNALARMSGPDRTTLVEEGLPPASAVRVRSATAELAGLAGTGGHVAVVVARVDLLVTSEIGSTPVTSHRVGEMTMVPDGDSWKIDSYDLTVARESERPAEAPGSTRP